MLSELTFTDQGIPFALFKGRRRCSLCSKEALHCFAAGIGDDVIVPCPTCAAEVGLDADARFWRNLCGYGTGVGFPDLRDSAVLACYRCLRSGRFALKKDTELGMIRLARGHARRAGSQSSRL